MFAAKDLKMKNIYLKEIPLPDFGKSPERPELPPSVFEHRLAATLRKMSDADLDFLLIFADREHSANLAFLTNLDPRFEEALFLLDKNGQHKLLLGNECMGYTGIVKLPTTFELYQPFSLMGQDRSKSRDLKTILRDFGIGYACTVGCAYYKTVGESPTLLDIPAYLADVLREIVSIHGRVINANDIFMDNKTGLRHQNCLEELVQMEWASCRSSDSIRRLILDLTIGKREYELAAHYDSEGLPYSCHPMVSTGEKARIGLSSPSGRQVALGDAFTSAFGIQGSLTCRAGFVAHHADDIADAQVRADFDKFWRNYFQTVVAWYESVGVGVKAADVCWRVEQARDNDLFDFAVNTGHTIHLDEWVNSPFTLDSTIELYSGMALQMDIIPVSKRSFVCANMEDGIVLADALLRAAWSSQFPESWQRIEARRRFMIDKLGIQLHESVLPLSNIPAYYAPYMLNHQMVAVQYG
jgi:hypothetical protein